MEGKRYNLRSGRREIHLPIQLQLSQDEDFVTQALGSDLASGQVSLTDLSGTSNSDIDVDELVHGSDRNLSDSESSPTSARYATALSGQVLISIKNRSNYIDTTECYQLHIG